MDTDDGDEIYYRTWEERLRDEILFNDDKDLFVSMVKGVRPAELVRNICLRKSVNCCVALINGETGQSLDLNAPCSKGHPIPPLHTAAQAFSPELVELFLYHGARTDLRCMSHYSGPENPGKLPLNLALESLWVFDGLRNKWTPKLSIFKLIFTLCLPEMQNALETIELIAWQTNETEEEMLHYAREGKLIELAALLMVAREKVTNPFMKLRDCILTEFDALSFEGLRLTYNIARSKLAMMEDKKQLLMSGLQLLEVFERAGDAIQAYVQQNKTHVSHNKAMTEVADLLKLAGFVLKPQDTLCDLIWFQHEKFLDEQLFIAGQNINLSDPPRDIGMRHYSWTNHRWTCRVSSEKEPKSVFVPNEILKFTSVPPPPSPPFLSAIVRSCHTLRVLEASAGLKFPIVVEAEVNNKVKGLETCLRNVPYSKTWALAILVIKKGLRRI